ncbi:hypothetical protein QE152_g40141 [Popillia japonica]|uniref:Uncharacterized protein n=1 Tax=Popillia japonica TaxID=7064 RepID=A0AAW1HS66_POPJA
MSSKKQTTPSKPERTCSIIRCNIARALATPKGLRLYYLIDGAAVESPVLTQLLLNCIQRGQATVVINMAAEHFQKIDFSELHSEDSNPDPFLNESEHDKDYTVSGSSSDSEGIDSRTENEDPNIPQTSRGFLPTPEKKTSSRWRHKNIQRHKKIKTKTKRNLGHGYVNTKGKARANKIRCTFRLQKTM